MKSLFPNSAWTAHNGANGDAAFMRGAACNATFWLKHLEENGMDVFNGTISHERLGAKSTEAVSKCTSLNKADQKIVQKMPQGFSYSKWDKLEVSDDDEFECHPNVDKASMVRWKQAEVHRKRRERQDKIKALGWERAFNAKVGEAFSSRRGELDMATWTQLRASIVEWDKTLAHDVMVLAHTDRDPRWQPPQPDSFFMQRVDIPTLCKALDESVAAGDSSALAKVLDGYMAAFKDRNASIDKEIKKEEEAIQSVISSETMKEGFSKSIVSKETAPAPAPEKKKKTTKVKETEIITLNGPDASKQVATSAEPTSKPAPTEAESNAAAGATPETDDDDVYISDPTVDAFSKLTTLDVSYSHLSRAPWLLDEKYSDQILAEAFNAGIRGDLARTRVCVHQSLLLQYCRLLGKDGVRLFFERLRTKGHKGQEAFFTDVESTYARIEKRVGELKREEEEAERKEKEEGEARARAALQPDGTYALPVTEESSEEDLKRAEVFKELPVALQRALLTQDIDEINAFLGSSSKEDTEKYVSLATSVGLISLSTEED